MQIMVQDGECKDLECVLSTTRVGPCVARLAAQCDRCQSGMTAHLDLADYYKVRKLYRDDWAAGFLDSKGWYAGSERGLCPGCHLAAERRN